MAERNNMSETRRAEDEMMGSENVVILGLSPLSGGVPLGAEVWSINHLPRAALSSRWFHLHGNDHINRSCPPGELARMTALAKKIPVYMLCEGQVPGARAFPFDAVRRFVLGVLGVIGCEMGEHPEPVYDNTFPWLIAFAVYLGAEHIYMDGIDYRRSDERWAVPAIEWMLGFAWGQGVTVHLPEGCGLMGNNENFYGMNGPGCV